MSDKEYIEELIDFEMPLKNLQKIISKLIEKHGKDAVIFSDAGYNNVQVCIKK